MATRPALAILVLLLFASVSGCALLPEDDRLSGEVVPGEGITIGRGQFADGTPWQAQLRRQGGDVCSTAVVGGLEQGTSCTSAQGGLGGSLSMSSGTGMPTIMEGFYRHPVAALRVEATDGVHDVQLVSLAGLGLPDLAFALALAPGIDPIAITTLDGAGEVIDRFETGPNR